MPFEVDTEEASRMRVQEFLLDKREINRKRKRQISNHVISRWYRPPEIIFIEKLYDQSVDMWSIGCVLSDMLMCCEPFVNKNHDIRQRCLFRGNSCFPLSPKNGQSKQISSQDQIIKIVERLPILTL